MSGQALVSIRALKRSFGDVRAVDGVDLDIREGEFLTLLGPSGSGKTTVLRMIAGFEKPDSGSITLAGKDVSQLPPYERDVNTVFQDYALFPHMDVLTNIEYGLRVKGVSKEERRAQALVALKQIRLEGYEDRKPAQLSGGQRQRVALARALVNKPSVLLLDEPLGALDLKLREQMQIELKALQREVGITFIFVTHDQEEALSMSDRIAIFNHGKIEQLGTPREIYDNPKSAFISEFVGQTNRIEIDGKKVNIRPEFVSISKSGTTGDRVVQGILRDEIFVGASTRYLVETNLGFSMISTQVENDLKIGDAVTLSWQKEREFLVQI
ncbi:ABC transporter ATP-binding protein [Actinobacteria bacterium IMCC26103]|nr:ABC transporter ATP-binding protein [Actinobacteria bacterium IMCC26103]